VFIKSADKKNKIFTEIANYVMIAQMGSHSTNNFIVRKKFMNSEYLEQNL